MKGHLLLAIVLLCVGATPVAQANVAGPNAHTEHVAQANVAAKDKLVERSTSRDTGSSAAEPAPAGDVEALFAEAQRLYEAGALQEALEKMSRCYEQTRAVNLLYNLAVIYRELGDCPRALEYFQRYVREAQTEEQRDSANQQITSLSQQCPPPPVPVVPPAPEVTPKLELPAETSSAARKPALAPDAGSLHSSRWTNAGWVAMGAGVLAAAGAGYFTLEAIDAQHDSRLARNADEFEARNSALARNSAIAWILGTSSLVAFGFGTYSFVRAGQIRRTSAVVLFRPAPSGVLVDYRLRF